MTSKIKLSILFGIIIIISGSPELKAQLGLDPNDYSYLANQFGTSNYTAGAKSGVLPSVTTFNGFNSYLQNPAVMGLASESGFYFSLINNTITEESLYLSNLTNDSQNTFNLGEIGFAYKVPTYQGSLVVGGGYTTTNIYNRIDHARAFNDRSSITEYFAEPGSGFETLAFETYAADYLTENSTSLTSIFRLNGRFRGINQDIIRRQTGRTGNYSVFVASEFAKGLFVGASLGYSIGTHRYRNNFLEADLQNNYGRAIIPSDDGVSFTDVETLEFGEDLESEHYGLDLRTGFVYDASIFKIGASIYLPAQLRVEEDYYNFLQNNLDDGSEPFFFEEEFGLFKYRVRRPREFNIGISSGNIMGFEVSAAILYRDLSKTEVDFVSDFDGNGIDRLGLSIDQDIVNEQINSIYQSTTDYRFGLKYDLNDQTELYGGYAYLESPSTEFEAIRTQLSGGFEFKLSPEWTLNIAGQYTAWNDRSTLYEFGSDNSAVREQTSLRTQAFNLVAGIRYTFR